MKPTEETWIAGKPRDDGSVQVYMPNLGPCRVIVPVAETEVERGDLIAAAPELYRALEAALESWSETGTMSRDALQDAMGALRKARGE